MSYRPQEFWEQRLAEQFDLRGTGETGLSLAYNRACYALRADVLTAALRRAGLPPRGRRVLDVGCGTGFWTDYYVSRGAGYTGVDIAQVSVDRLAARYPEQRFVRASNRQRRRSHRIGCVTRNGCTSAAQILNSLSSWRVGLLPKALTGK